MRYAPQSREARKRAGNAVGDLFDSEQASTLARTSDPLPSHRAAAEMVETGALNAQCTAALERLREYVDQWGESPTTAELARTHGEAEFHKYVRIYGKRLPDLAQRGSVVRGRERVCKVSGRKVTTWEPK